MSSPSRNAHQDSLHTEDEMAALLHDLIVADGTKRIVNSKVKRLAEALNEHVEASTHIRAQALCADATKELLVEMAELRSQLKAALEMSRQQTAAAGGECCSLCESRELELGVVRRAMQSAVAHQV